MAMAELKLVPQAMNISRRHRLMSLDVSIEGGARERARGGISERNRGGRRGGEEGVTVGRAWGAGWVGGVRDVVDQAAEHNAGGVEVDAAPHGVENGVGLLVDLLEHEVRELALHDLLQLRVKRLRVRAGEAGWGLVGVGVG